MTKLEGMTKPECGTD